MARLPRLTVGRERISGRGVGRNGGCGDGLLVVIGLEGNVACDEEGDEEEEKGDGGAC